MGVIDVEEPPAPGRGEVQLDVAYCGVCGSDLHQVEYGFAEPNTILGHEFSATVRAAGEGADSFEAGTRVAVRPFLACGGCRSCESGRDTYCRDALAIGTAHGLAAAVIAGGMAPRINVPARALHRVPSSITLEHAALIEPLAVALHAVRGSDIERGGSAVVMGAGPIGVALVCCLRAAGAGTIIVTERSRERAERAASFGADQIVVAGEEDVDRRVNQLTHGGADVVFDAVGMPGMLEEAVRHVAPGGRVQVVGVCMEPDSVFPAGWLMKEPRIQICFVYTEAEFAEMAALVGSGKVDAERMISRVEPIGAVAEVFESLRNDKRDVKVLLKQAD
jgi:(R,R)-butanediol dehydrogenase/meso-butanediol dehydrogenase/diacetyl reductase